MLRGSSRGFPQQVVRVGLVDFGERHDTRTNGQHYTAADRRPTNQVSVWQAERRSRPTRTICCGHPREDETSRVLARMSRDATRVEFKLNRAWW